MFQRNVERCALFFFIVALLGVGACTVEFDPAQDETFSCMTDQDCLSNFECRSGVCARRNGGGPPTCTTDRDGDGFGSAESIEERQACEKCLNFGRCGRDCDDTNPDVYPGAPEGCDGINNNCDAEGVVDELTPCQNTTNCAAPPVGGVVTCDNASGATCNSATDTDCVCTVKMALQLCDSSVTDCMCNANPIACVSGMWEPIPLACQ